MSRKVSIALIGAGNRGRYFAELIRGFESYAQLVAVVEPRQEIRDTIAKEHEIAPEKVFASWHEFIAQPKMCDGVIIATMDREHAGPAIACFDLGYHVMLEKPMAVSLEDCRLIAEAQKRAGTISAVCHSLRYQKGFAKVREIVASGRLGEIVSIDHIEQIGYFHFPHSFVRGNWGNEARSTFSLLAKSCHDLDYIAYLADRECVRVGSFGALQMFAPEKAPKGVPQRCSDGCPIEVDCPFSAIKEYVQNLHGWAVFIGSDHSPEGRMKAIQEGPYGRCVWKCDNDVMDHQVVMLEFKGGATATFTMIAQSEGGRKLRIYGEKAELFFDEGSVRIKDHQPDNVEMIHFGPEPGGHGGGDFRALRQWIEAIRTNRPSRALTDVQTSFETHKIVFAAEKARREKRLVDLSEI